MQHVEPADWHATVESLIAQGFDRFVTLTGVDTDGVQVWLRLRDAAGTDAVLATTAERVDTIIDVLPDAAWAERETAEMFGVVFIGHDTAPLLLTSDAPPVPLRKSMLLDARNTVPWPGGKEPGESGDRPPSRRRLLPPGVRP